MSHTLSKREKRKLFHPEKEIPSFSTRSLARRIAKRVALKILKEIEDNPEKPLPVLLRDLRTLLHSLDLQLKQGYSPFRQVHIIWLQKIESSRRSESYIYAELVGPCIADAVFNVLEYTLEVAYGCRVETGSKYQAKIIDEVGEIFYDRTSGPIKPCLIAKTRARAEKSSRKITVNYRHKGLVVDARIKCEPERFLDEVYLPLRRRHQEFVKMITLTPRDFFADLKESLS